ncbi:hypothetical protein M3231_22345 [Neobacillus mesonae]|nr:hypothetical protein [Neobacillus mesonae]
MMSEIISALPGLEGLKKRMMILAALDTILSDEDWLRVHRYKRNWEPNAELGTIDNGAGDHLYVLFTLDGALMKGFDHESPMSPHARDDGEVWPGMYAGVPEPLIGVLQTSQDELEPEDVTFCLWQDKGESFWSFGNLLDTDELDEEEKDGGADFLLGYLEDTPEAYTEWATDYYTDQVISLDAVRRIFEAESIDERCIFDLNPQRNVQEVFDELESIGIPVIRN